MKAWNILKLLSWEGEFLVYSSHKQKRELLLLYLVLFREEVFTLQHSHTEFG